MSELQEIQAEILVDLHLQLEKEQFQVTPDSVDIFKRLGIKIERLPLENSLVHGSPLVRGISTKLLGRLKDPKSVHNLMSVPKDEDPWVRALAYEALGNYSGLEIAEAILPGIQDSEWKVRGTAIQAIAPYRLDNAKQKLVEILDKDLNEDVKAAAARALSFYDDDTLREPLFKALQSALPKTRAMALKALGTKSPFEPALDSIREILQDPHPWVRSSAVWCLGSWTDYYSISVIQPLLEDTDPKVQIATVKALGLIISHELNNSEHSAQLDALRQKLNNDWVHTLENSNLSSHFAIQLLNSISLLSYPISQGQKKIIERWSHHTEADIRLEAVKVMCNCSAWESREPLLDIFTQVGETPIIRSATLELLSRQSRYQDDPSSRKTLIDVTREYLASENAWLVGGAILSAKNMQLTELGEDILSHFNHSHPDVRGRACEVAAQLKVKDVEVALIYTLREDAESMVRYKAAESLLDFCQDHRVQDALMYAINDEDTSVAISCVQTLSKAAQSRTIKTLQNVLQGQDVALKLATARSLERFQHPDWIDWIDSHHQQEENKMVRTALLETLASLKNQRDLHAKF